MTKEEKREQRAKWHRWFAWRPIIMKDHLVLFEEVVRRKKTYWQYKDMIDFLAMSEEEHRAAVGGSMDDGSTDAQ